MNGQIVRWIGVLVGLLAGVLLLTIGFWKTVLLAALGFVGWLLTGGYPVLLRRLREFDRRQGGQEKEE